MGFIQSNDMVAGRLIIELSKRQSLDLVQRTEYNALRLCNHTMRTCLYKQFRPEETAVAVLYAARMVA